MTHDGAHSGRLHLRRSLWGPMDSSNFRHRVLHTLTEGLGLPKLTFPGHPPHHRDAWQDEGSPQGHSGHDATLEGLDTTDVYMQSLEQEVRTAINSIYTELTGRGSAGPAPQAPPSASANAMERNIASSEGNVVVAKPVRGVVLEFATKMRQHRGREVLLNT